MKVLVVPTWYPNGKDKLMGVYHKEFTEALNRNGIKADMLYIDRQRLSKPLKYLFMKKRVIINEVNYKVYINKMLDISKISFKLQIKNYINKLEKLIKMYISLNGKPDIIHAQVLFPAGYACSVIGEKYDIPVIVTEHYSGYEKFFKEEKYKEYSSYVLNNAIYTTVSNYMKENVSKYTKVKCYVLPNLVDTKPFLNNVKRTKEKTFKLVSVSALRKGKRLDIVFRALKILVDKNIDIHLDIVGDGFYEDIFKKDCQELGLDDYVTFLGRKNKREIAEILKNENALIIGSEIETFCIPGVEAMASGIPIVSTDCLGPSEYVDKNVGNLCKVNNPEDMAEKIEDLINRYDSFDSEYIREKANIYGEEAVVKTALSLYERAINKKEQNDEK